MNHTRQEKRSPNERPNTVPGGSSEDGPDGSVRALVWCREDQIELALEVIDLVGLDAVSAGSPRRGESGLVAEALGARPVDDLRAALVTTDVSVAWLLDPGSFGDSAAKDDTQAANTFRERGGVVYTQEPVPSQAVEAAGLWGSGTPSAMDAVRFVPLARLSPGFRAARELFDAFGAVRTMSVETLCRRGEGSLGARLFGAMELVFTIMGEPDRITAAFASPAHEQGFSAVQGDSLRGLSGDLCVTVSFGDGRAASVLASDCGAAWTRRVSLLGSGGRLDLSDDGFVWIDHAGVEVDRGGSSDPGTPGGASSSGRVIADALARDLDRSQPRTEPLDHRCVLALAQTALLSARTRQPESPETLLRMVGA